MNSQNHIPTRAQRILVAEDNDIMRSFLFRFLTGEGFVVYTAEHGELAWEALRNEHFDLLITDNEMPHLSGTKLIERIRTAGMTLPIVMVSASFEIAGVRDYAALQITAVISKPFDIMELLTVGRTALRISAREEAASPERYANSPVLSAAAVKPTPVVNKLVLIADDDDVVRGSLAAVLESEGYVVDEARDGVEAVSHAIKNKPDLVLLDLNMPNADGWTAFNQLDRVTPLLPVIVITARPNQYKEAVRAGVDAFMEKPLNIPVLVRAIKSLTNEDETRHVRRITNRAFVTRLLSESNA